MSDDWQVGDLAVCVDASPDWRGDPVSLVDGQTYRIIRVGEYGLSKFGPSLGLFVAGASPNQPGGFADARFRKIRPDQHESCEPEFVTLLKRIKTPAYAGGEEGK